MPARHASAGSFDRPARTSLLSMDRTQRLSASCWHELGRQTSSTPMSSFVRRGAGGPSCPATQTIVFCGLPACGAGALAPANTSIRELLQIVVLFGQRRPAIVASAIRSGGERCVHTTVAGRSDASGFHSKMVVEANREGILGRGGIPWRRAGSDADRRAHCGAARSDLVQRDDDALVEEVRRRIVIGNVYRSEEHTSELQSLRHL